MAIEVRWPRRPARELKPAIPQEVDGIPLRHELELEVLL
jgi:hypothetical protein